MNNIENALVADDITHKLSKNAQILLAPRFPYVILDYNEEQPCATDLRSRIVRKAKKLILNLAWSYIYRKPLGYSEPLLFQRYSFFSTRLSFKLYKLLKNWQCEIFTRQFSRAIYFGITAKESELPAAYAKLSHILESLGTPTVKGSLNGAMQLQFYTEFPSEERKYGVLAYIHTTRQFSDMVHELLKTAQGRKSLDELFIIQEGGYPPELNKAIAK